MEKAESQKQRRMVTGSSIRGKPLSSITNLIPKSHRHSTSFSQSNKPISSAAAAADPAMSDSSIGSTQTRNHLQHLITVQTDRHSLPIPPTPSPDDWVGNGNHIACTRRQTMLKTRSKTNAAPAVPVYPIHIEKTKNDLKNSKNNTEKEIATPINFETNKTFSTYAHKQKHLCRNEVDGAEDVLQSKSLTDFCPTIKKRKWSSKGISKEYVTPQDFIDQQNAYFKEIDEYELQVEEVE